MDEILAECTNPALVRCLFSATLPPAIEEMARTVMHDPIRIVIGQRCVLGGLGRVTASRRSCCGQRERASCWAAAAVILVCALR